jgi:serine/threonine protein kinase
VGSFTADSNSFNRHYELGARLGSGGFAVVKSCVDKITGKTWAVKITDLQRDENSELLREEFDLQHRLAHPAILRVKDFFMGSSRAYMIMEQCEAGDIASHIACLSHLSEAAVVRVILPLMDAMKYLHRHNVVHRDIKPDNVLLTRDTRDGRDTRGGAKISRRTSTERVPELLAAPTMTGNDTATASADTSTAGKASGGGGGVGVEDVAGDGLDDDIVLRPKLADFGLAYELEDEGDEGEEGEEGEGGEGGKGGERGDVGVAGNSDSGVTAATKKKKKKKKKKEKDSKTGKTSMAGTLEYFSPELLEFHAGIGADTEGSHLGTPADIWALGVLVFTCLEGYVWRRGTTKIHDIFIYIIQSGGGVPQRFMIYLYILFSVGEICTLRYEKLHLEGYHKDSLYIYIQCSEIFTLRYEKLHTET